MEVTYPKGLILVKILLINGYTPHPDARGKLTQALVELSATTLSPQHQVKQSNVLDYDLIEEYHKFQWADLILLYFPLYWYAVPWGLKRYLDDVFEKHRFYDADAQGRPVPLMTGKSFGYVTTLAAVEDTYRPGNSLTQGLTVDDLLQPLTVTFRYVGIEQQPRFQNCVFYDVYDSKQVTAAKETLTTQLLSL